MATAAQLPDDTTELSAKYETPLGLAHGTMQALKDRIKQHYDLASDYYLSLWYVPPTSRATLRSFHVCERREAWQSWANITNEHKERHS